MRVAGQIALFRFPQVDLLQSKLRPALLLGELPGPYGDWLICMVSSQLHQAIEGFDEIIAQDDADYGASGLKSASVIRIGRLAVIEGTALLGAIGTISQSRLQRVRQHLADWLTQES